MKSSVFCWHCHSGTLVQIAQEVDKVASDLKSVRTICVTHTAPLLPDTFIDYSIGLGDYWPARGSHISKLDSYWAGMREISYGAAGNYVVPHVIEQQAPRTDSTAIFFHRKFIMQTCVGQPAAAYPIFREIPREEVIDISRDVLRPRGDEEFLIAAPLRFPEGLMLQYTEVHNAIDMYEYIACATRLGMLSADEARAFTLETMFVTGGCELGIYPTSWLYETLKKLGAIGRAFLTEAESRIRSYDSYQVRAVGFLAERLGSFFLLQELRRRYPNGLPGALIGHLYSVTENGVPYSPATAES